MTISNPLRAIILCGLFAFFVLPIETALAIDVTDDAGKTHHFNASPQRVVSLVPSATEIIFAIGAQDHLTGITYHSAKLPGADSLSLVGGFFSPSLERIMELTPDLVIASGLHDDLRDHLEGKVPVLIIETRKMEDSFRHSKLLGKLFARQDEAQKLIDDNRRQLKLIARKIAKIPADKRKRVMRLMGAGKLMTAGANSFQNEIIEAAGGIAPDFVADGQIVPVPRDQVAAFNPQALYYCGWNRQDYLDLLKEQKLTTIDAATTQAIYSFPCDLTCRASSHLGYFVSWLSSLLYSDEFSKEENEILPREILASKPVTIKLPFVKKASVLTSVIHDFRNKSLLVEFTSPRSVVSTLEGQRDNIMSVGNHYSPAPCWALNHSSGLAELRQEIFPVLGKEEDSTSFLFTGADMDNLVISEQQFKDMKVYALVTAGVSGNAVRMSRDTGNYYEPGTINMIILSNMKMTPRAMTRAIISATEAKTAALQDLNIRSTVQPLTAGATGTGTDNIIVVQGEGVVIDSSGGHTKMGELIAKAAYAGVQNAIARQNGIVAKRDIFQRLAERHLSVRQLISASKRIPRAKRKYFSGALERVLLDPVYSGFIESALSLADGLQQGHINNLEFFQHECLSVAGRLSHTEITALTPFLQDEILPKPVNTAFNALLTGISAGKTTADLSSPENERNHVIAISH